MKTKPQISFGPSIYGAMTWTKGGKKITEQEARKCFEKGDCDFSIPAWQEMTATIAAENLAK